MVGGPVSLDQLVHATRQAKDCGDLLTLLRKHEAVINSSHAGQLRSALQNLDPTANALAFIFMLDAMGNQHGNQQVSSAFLDLFAEVARQGDPGQIRLAPDKFTSMCRKASVHAQALHNPRRAILPLRNAIHRLSGAGEGLITPIHADLAQCCLLAQCYNAIVPILAEPMFDVNPKKTAMTPKELLLYCYYGGMIHIGRKDYGAALQIFLHALTVPSHVVNAITLEAYKKWILVSLINSGSQGVLPKFVPSQLPRAGKQEAKEYLEFAKQYTSSSAGELQALADKARDKLQEAGDNNWGLIKLCLDAKAKRSIQRLTQTFLTLSLADMAHQAGVAGPGQAEEVILRMIDAGEIHAQIDEAAGMVRFLEDVEQRSDVQVQKRLEQCLHQSMQLDQRLQVVNREVSADPEYLRKVSSKDRPRFDDPAAGDLDAMPQVAGYQYPDA
eukprot:jgi/Astpho2/13/e_gw1.00001.28.1_t